jgi:hypothetical protein
MEGNVLIGSGKSAGATVTEPQRVINLVSNAPASKITGLEGFLRVFNGPQVRGEVNPFRYVIQRKARRGMGGKFGKGLTHEVTESIEVNPNEDLFGLRRWLGGIRQDPSCVMLLNIGRIGQDALAAPLVFSDMIRSGRPILVTGADYTAQDQLQCPIDFTFSTIPPQVASNPSLKLNLASRVHRRKGFASSVRSVLEIDGVPKAISDKVGAINSGADASTLSEAEVINLCLLADLVARYLPAITQFKEALRNNTLQMPQLVSMFELLTNDMTLGETVEAFQGFFPEEMAADPSKVRSRGQAFGEVYRFLNARDSAAKGGKAGKMDEFFRALASLVIRHRAKVDPPLWRSCGFLWEPTSGEQSQVEGLKPFYGLLAKTLQGGPEAITPEFAGRMGETIFQLVHLANQTPEEGGSGDESLIRRAMAARLLPLFRLQKFAAASLVNISEKNREVLLNKERFHALFGKIPIPVEELKEVEARLRAVVLRNETIAAEVKKSTLDVMLGHTRDRDKALREIYILSAVPELINFNFLLVGKGMSDVERKSAMSVTNNRMGLEFASEPTEEKQVALFARDDEPPPGKLQNDPMLVSRAYTTLIGLQVQRLVRRAVDHKIGYLQSTFGENFFEVIYDLVVTRNDMPLSRNQLAQYIQRYNLLGNLQAKGWKQEQENELVDDFMTMEEVSLSARKPKDGAGSFADFPKRYAALARQFDENLERLKTQAAEDARPENPAALVWSLYEQGSYNLSRADAKEAFRKSVFYEYLKDMIAQISSENYSAFTKEIQQEGVKIYVPPKYFFLLTVGTRFAFLVSEKIVRYQLIATPIERFDQLDTVSRVFAEKIDERMNNPQPLPDVLSLKRMGDEIQRCNLLWWEYSRHLGFALVDRVLSETVIKQLQPGSILPNNLWYLPDESKLCLGQPAGAADSVPFQKFLQLPEAMGNIQKNPKSSSTTIDDFSIEVHKFASLRAELENITSIAEDVLDILQNLTHMRGESALVLKYEQNLGNLIKVLNQPIRHFSEREVQILHTLAKGIQDTLRTFYQTPGSTKDQFVTLLQNQLRARRSDGHQFKLTFTDPLILETTEIQVMQKVKQGDEIVSRRKKMQVEVDSRFQTLATRVREVIRTHELLNNKEHIVFSPDGQKKKQIDYVLGIIDTLQVLRGNALTFYCDLTMLDDSQLQQIATRIKPHCFFKMDEVRPEPAAGTTTTAVKDPLTGRLVAGPAKGQDAKPAAAAPARPLAPAGEVTFTASKNPGVKYRFAANSYSYLEPESNAAVPARALPVDIGPGREARILFAKLPSGRFVFHGLLGGDVLLPRPEKPAAPVICVFDFAERRVRVVNEGGKPVVQVDPPAAGAGAARAAP